MPEPIHVEVYAAEGCQATTATLGKLELLGITPEVHPMDRLGKAWLFRQGFTKTPVVIVHVGEGQRRIRWSAFEGFNPKMLELAARIGKEDG